VKPSDRTSPPQWLLGLPIVLGACTGMGSASGDLQTHYEEARSLLEAGRPDAALAAYDAALAAPGASALESRLLVEQAHALLRVGRAGDAVSAARRAADVAPDPGAVRDARLVLGAALHDAVRARSGARDLEAENALREAHELMREAAGTHPDPNARSFASTRLIEVRESLAALEIARLRDDLAASDLATARERAAYIETEYAGLAVVMGAADLLRRARTL
jgi:tetratricopeptide (TPR) repeat protein